MTVPDDAMRRSQRPYPSEISMRGALRLAVKRHYEDNGFDVDDIPAGHYNRIVMVAAKLLDERTAERDERQARIDAATAELRKWDALATRESEWLPCRAGLAALQGDQPTEPRHELVLKSGLSGVTGACSCGGWSGGGRHELPSRVAHRWDAEHLTSLPLEQSVEPVKRCCIGPFADGTHAANCWQRCQDCGNDEGRCRCADVPAESQSAP
jgi:hypothetical protein